MSDEAIYEAERLANAGEPDAAIQVLLTQLAKNDPPSTQLAAHGMLADLYASRLQVDQAVAHYDFILQYAPQLSMAHFAKGMALKQRLTRESQEAAVASLLQAQRLGHDESEVFSNVGFCQKMMADFGLVDATEREAWLGKARQSFLHALELSPENHHARFHLGDLEFNAGNWEEARRAYGKLLAAQPSDPRVLVRMANTMHHLGESELALLPLDLALKQIVHRKEFSDEQSQVLLREIEVDCHFCRGEVMKQLARTTEAKREYQAVIDLVDPTAGLAITNKMHSCRASAEVLLQGMS